MKLKYYSFQRIHLMKKRIVEIRAGTGGEEAALLPQIFLECTKIF